MADPTNRGLKTVFSIPGWESAAGNTKMLPFGVESVDRETCGPETCSHKAADREGGLHLLEKNWRILT